ncbi:hypothetical protein K7472_24880 [Streptomyces sp. PTM05]|uniref:DUF5753 domain-containing protein n=1 Tax=Streptantibioticus parmotrematis TaxID=2873249 RepID=A0ABS7QXW9_9ACTN|nr:hypothetical protein [Streptantibioticus parmotrematis]MBY8888050.1 hypothetical protein [Streptantibioticus parmotrematis]
MRSFVAGHEARSTTDFLELALGTPVELWFGEQGESAEERAAREAAARDILADDPALYGRMIRLAADLIGAPGEVPWGVAA